MKIGFLFGDPAFDGAFRLASFLQSHEKDSFEPVIIGPEPIYTAALSRTVPELIDRFPVYTVPIGLVIRGEASAAGGECTVKAIQAACHLLAVGKIDVLSADGIDQRSLSLYSPTKNDLLSYLSAFFPGAPIGSSLFLSPGPVTRFTGLPGEVLEGDPESCLSVLKTIKNI